MWLYHGALETIHAHLLQPLWVSSRVGKNASAYSCRGCPGCPKQQIDWPPFVPLCFPKLQGSLPHPSSPPSICFNYIKVGTLKRKPETETEFIEHLVGGGGQKMRESIFLLAEAPLCDEMIL